MLSGFFFQEIVLQAMSDSATLIQNRQRNGKRLYEAAMAK